MNKLIISLGLTLISFPAFSVILEKTEVNQIYAQSVNGANDSAAHAIRVNKSIDPVCEGRLHIDPRDKELFSTVLAYKLSNTTFNLMYSINETPAFIAGHLFSKCKLFSIY